MVRNRREWYSCEYQSKSDDPEWNGLEQTEVMQCIGREVIVQRQYFRLKERNETGERDWDSSICYGAWDIKSYEMENRYSRLLSISDNHIIFVS